MGQCPRPPSTIEIVDAQESSQLEYPDECPDSRAQGIFERQDPFSIAAGP